MPDCLHDDALPPRSHLGFVVVAIVRATSAAGNDGNDMYRYPASYSSVVSVGAVDATKVVGWFSQRNDQVNLVAPGVDIFSTVPGGCVRANTQPQHPTRKYFAN